MRTLIVYDSKYGNTRQVAQAIGESIDGALVAPIDEADLVDLKAYELVIVGSPTQGGRPTPAVAAYLRNLPAGGLKGIGVTAFDTRIGPAGRGVFLKTIIRIFGYAAGRIANALQAKGGKLVAAAEGFLVEDTEGPLAGGELERARAWARQLAGIDAAVQR